MALLAAQSSRTLVHFWAVEPLPNKAAYRELACETVLSRARDDDQFALNELYWRVRREAFWRICRRWPQWRLADEVAHEIAQESWLSIQSHDPERSTWRTYFVSIARNVLNAKYRKHSREQPVDLASVGELLGEADGLAASQLEAAPEHESQAMADESNGLLMRAVAELDENERSALILVRVKGLTFAQAATQLGLPAGKFNHTLRNATTKARAALTRLLHDNEP